LLDGHSLLQATWARSLRLAPAERILIVGSAAHEALYHEQLPDLPADNLLLEPEGKNTAPCIAWSVQEVLKREAEGVIVTLSADHAILNEDEWFATMQDAAAYADQTCRLVNVGITPPDRATRYGYMACRPGPVSSGGHEVYEVEQFVEKPASDALDLLMSTGTVLRNMGMFAWRADVMQAELERYLPAVASSFGQLASGQHALAETYANCPSISIDHGVSQKSERLSVIHSAVRRIDVGSYTAFASLWGTDEAGNAVQGAARLLDVSESVIYAETGTDVRVIGLDNVVVAVDAGRVLVCPLGRAQDLKLFVDS
ncbi:MAG: sugar phosphate nucleotidyltransferase, partial [Bacteroidota bacterium]